MNFNGKYNIDLKVDCRNLELSAIDELTERIEKYGDVHIVGGDMIYIFGKVTETEYHRLWKIFDDYNVKVD